jgi:hypothetical protein
MLIEHRSLITGVLRTLNLPITEEQIEKWESGAFAQDAFPNLTPSLQKFLTSGATSTNPTF